MPRTTKSNSGRARGREAVLGVSSQGLCAVGWFSGDTEPAGGRAWKHTVSGSADSRGRQTPPPAHPSPCLSHSGRWWWREGSPQPPGRGRGGVRQSCRQRHQHGKGVPRLESGSSALCPSLSGPSPPPGALPASFRPASQGRGPERGRLGPSSAPGPQIHSTYGELPGRSESRDFCAHPRSLCPPGGFVFLVFDLGFP